MSFLIPHFPWSVHRVEIKGDWVAVERPWNGWDHSIFITCGKATFNLHVYSHILFFTSQSQNTKASSIWHQNHTFVLVLCTPPNVCALGTALLWWDLQPDVWMTLPCACGWEGSQLQSEVYSFSQTAYINLISLSIGDLDLAQNQDQDHNL